MKKLVVFSGSSSINSINEKLAVYAANQLEEVEVKLLQLEDYTMPFYSSQFEKQEGIPEQAHLFIQEIKKADGIIISMPEYNGSFPAIFKNI